MNTTCVWPGLRIGRGIAGILLAAGFLWTGGRAAAVTWDGGGANGYWTIAANWAGDTNPLAGDNLIFTGTVRRDNTNDLLASAGWMYFPTAATNFSLYGTGAGVTLALGGNITNFGIGTKIAMNLTFAATRTIVVTNGGSLEIAGNIGGTGGLNMYGRNHYLTLSGNNTFTGGVNIQSGYVIIKNSASLGTGTKTITMTAGTAGDPRLFLDGSGGDIDLPSTMSFQTSNNNGSIMNVAGNNTIRGNFTLTSGGGDTWLVVSNGTLTLTGTFTPNTTARTLRLEGPGDGFHMGAIVDGTAANTLALRKLGSGTWTLSGTNTYTRDTSIESGRLVLGATGSIGKTTNINVFAGATFDVSAPAGGLTLSAHQTLLGAGVVTGDVTTATGTRIVAATSGTAGTLTFGNTLSLAAGTTNLIDLGASPAGVNDRIVVGNHLIAAGLIQIGLLDGPLDTTQPYRLFDYGGGLFNAFSGVEVPNSRYTATLDTTVAQQVNVTFTGAALDRIWSGGTPTWDLGTTAAWNADADTFLNPDNVRFDDTAAGGHTVTLNTTVLPSSMVVSGATDYAITGAGRITGSTGLIKDGAGTLTLGTANEYTGATEVRGGTLKLGAAAGVPNNTTVIVANGAIFDFNGVTPGATRTNTFIISGDGGDGLGVIRDSLSTNAISGNSSIYALILSNNATLGTAGRFDIGLNGAAGSRLDGNGFTLTKIGTGTNDLRVQYITNLPTVVVQAGTLRYESFSHTDADSAGTTNIVGAGATLESWGSLTLNMPMVLNGGLLRNGSGTPVWTGNARLDVDTLIASSAGNLTMSGAVSGVGGIVKMDGNTLVLAGSNSYLGLTVVSNGAVQAANNNALGDASVGSIVVGGNGTGGYSLNLAGNITVAAEPLTLEGNLVGRAYLRNSSGTNTWSGPIAFTADSNTVGLTSDAGLMIVDGDIRGTASNGASFFLRGGAAGVIAGNLSVTGALFKTDDGSWTIGAPGKTYDWSSVSIARGTLRMADTNLLSPLQPVTMGEAAQNTARLDLNGFNQTIAGLQTNAGVTGAAAVTNTGGAATLTISNWADYVFNKALADGGPSNLLHLVKDGAGAQTFAGATTYRGVTTIKDGHLILAHALAAQNTTISNLVPGALVLDGATNVYSLGGLAGAVDLPLTNSAGAAVALTVGNNGDNTIYTGVLSEGGTLTKAGAGTLELTSVQTYGGGFTTLAGGTLRLSAGDNTLPTAMALVYTGDGTLDLGANSQTVASLTNQTNGADGAVTGSGRLTVTGDFRVGGTNTNTRATLDLTGLSELVIDNVAGAVEAGGMYPGGGTSNATGLLALARSSVITAAQLRVAMAAFGGGGRQQGMLELGPTNDFAVGSVQIGNNKSVGQVYFQAGLTNPVLRLRGTAGPASRADVLLGFGGSNVGPALGRMDLTANAVGGTLDALVGLLRAGFSAAGSQGASGEFLMGAGTLDVTEILLGASTNTGTGPVSGYFTLNGGSVTVQQLTLAHNSSGAAAVTGGVTLAGGMISAAVIQAGAGSAVRTLQWDAGTIRNYDAATDLAMGGVDVRLNGSGLHVFEIDAGRTGTVTAAMQGDGGLTKSGPGLLDLSGANAYTGPTDVSNGTLRVNGTHTGGGLVSVFNGGTLGGTGTVADVTVATGGRLSPGNSAGTLTLTGNLDLSAAGASDAGELVFELGVSAQDLIALTAGTLSLGGGTLGFNDFTFVDLGDLAPGQYTLVSTPNPVTGTLDGANLGGSVGAYSANLGLADGDTDLVLTVIPEPGALGAAGLLAVALLLRRRRAA